MDYFAIAPKGIEPLLAEELKALGAETVKPGQSMVAFRGTLETAYRACLWSRTASRILLFMKGFSAPDAEALYQNIKAMPWEQHLAVDGTLAVDVSTAHSQISHSRFGAQKVKDAIVDRFLEQFGNRPSVQRQRPNVRIHCHLVNDQAIVSLDLSGEALHRRGYRKESVIAPLKENLAAALLLKIGWPEIAASGGPLLDPLCGSATLPIEAAWMAADRAPGLLREYWGFLGWRQHNPVLWEKLLEEARRRRDKGVATGLPAIVGYDRDARAIRSALANAGAAGVQHLIHLECRELNRVESPLSRAAGLVIVNPPYGERLGEFREVESLYRQLGDLLKERFGGWRAGVFTGNPELGKRMGLRAHRVNTFYNGALTCRLLSFSVTPEFFVDPEAAAARHQRKALQSALSEGADGFVNRLSKNLRRLKSWVEQENITCYRLYDADIPEYAVAVDIYEQWVHIQEYEAPHSVPSEKAAKRLKQVTAVIPAVLKVPPERIFLKIRRRQKETHQYQKQENRGQFYIIHEEPFRFWVNLSDYLDTGLFLDHRLTRRWLGELAPGRRFLNLFGYTGTATVYASLNGARATTTVDMSRTYLDWTRRNLALNGVAAGGRHRLVQADCLTWIKKVNERFDLIFLDSPTFSNSKRMATNFDIQRDHVALIREAVRLLDEGGILIFSTHNRRFKMNREMLAELPIEDWTARTIPKDFARNPRIHYCWKITRAA